MNLYIKQKVFSWNDKFDIYDGMGNPVYHAESEFFTIGKKIHIYDMQGSEVAYIEQEILTFLPKYFVYMRGQRMAEVKMEWSLFKPRYTVIGPGWNVEGDFWAHEYDVTDSIGAKVAGIHKEWMTWGDTYELEIIDSQKEKETLAVLLCIDAVISSQRNSGA